MYNRWMRLVAEQAAAAAAASHRQHSTHATPSDQRKRSDAASQDRHRHRDKPPLHSSRSDLRGPPHTAALNASQASRVSKTTKARRQSSSSGGRSDRPSSSMQRSFISFAQPPSRCSSNDVGGGMVGDMPYSGDSSNGNSSDMIGALPERRQPASDGRLSRHDAALAGARCRSRDKTAAAAASSSGAMPHEHATAAKDGKPAKGRKHTPMASAAAAPPLAPPRFLLRVYAQLAEQGGGADARPSSPCAESPVQMFSIERVGTGGQDWADADGRSTAAALACQPAAAQLETAAVAARRRRRQPPAAADAGATPEPVSHQRSERVQRRVGNKVAGGAVARLEAGAGKHDARSAALLAAYEAELGEVCRHSQTLA